MTAIGQPLDDYAKKRAADVAEGVRKRLEIRHTETKETLPEDIRALVIETASTVTQQAIELAELKAEVAKLTSVMRDWLKGAA
jgi:macrodomain Ter protein organizer (MatP/YcbG family)